MNTFGQRLRYHRRKCHDDLRGGLLTQERLGELLGFELGDTGYSGAAVSDWERDKSSIDKDNRLVLVSLLTVLRKLGGFAAPEEAEALLLAGNYRPMNHAERSRVFPEFVDAPDPVPVGRQPVTGIADWRTWLGAAARERRNQLILLHKAKNFWVKGVLERSVKDSPLLKIDYRFRDDLVEQPWRQVMGPTVYGNRGRPYDEKIVDIFGNVDSALLIVGAPGSGKTTTLLMMARDLIGRAETLPGAPIPTILNLVSWAEKRAPLSEWIIGELVSKYQIPSPIGREWLANNELLLLLDGFDEVPARLRTSCVDTINRFRENHGLTGIVVCSRLDEYQSAATRLKLGGAIMLEPLTAKQVDAYLDAIEAPIAGLRAAVKQEERLAEMARTPLALNILRLAFGPADDDRGTQQLRSGVELDAAEKDPRRLLFGAYVERMFGRRNLETTYPTGKTKEWLAWLARKMVQHNQNMFYIEHVQPSWLPSRYWRYLYLLSTRLITGFYGGVAMWLLLLILRHILPVVPTGLSDLVAATLHLSPALAEVISFIAGNMILALLVALMQGFHFERQLGSEGEISDERQGWRQVAEIGLAVCLLTTAVLLPLGEGLLALAWGMTEAVFFMSIVRFTDGSSYRNEVRMVEALGWSWSSAAKGLLISILLALIAEAVEASLVGYNGMSRTLFTFSLAGLLLGGIRGRRLQETAFPNQGLWLSMKNGIIVALAAAFALGAAVLMVRDVTEALLMVLFMILFVGALYGGTNVVKHFLLRLILWQRGRFPRDCVDFLDYATALVLLRKVGGGYIFTHRLLQEHFAQSQTV